MEMEFEEEQPPRASTTKAKRKPEKMKKGETDTTLPSERILLPRRN